MIYFQCETQFVYTLLRVYSIIHAVKSIWVTFICLSALFPWRNVIFAFKQWRQDNSKQVVAWTVKGVIWTPSTPPCPGWLYKLCRQQLVWHPMQTWSARPILSCTTIHVGFIGCGARVSDISGRLFWSCGFTFGFRFPCLVGMFWGTSAELLGGLCVWFQLFKSQLPQAFTFWWTWVKIFLFMKE